MDIKYFTRKSHRYNEDRFVIGKNYVLILDGATSLYKTDDRPTSGSWFANFIKSHLKPYEEDIIASLNRISQLAFEERVSSLNAKNISYLPTAGIAAAVFKDKEIHLYHIGDCGIAVFCKNSTSHLFVQPALKALDQRVIEDMKRISLEKNISVLETRSFVNDSLIRNRCLANEKDGYSVFSISPSPDFAFSHEVISLDNVKSINLFTDGFSSSWEILDIYPTYKEAFDHPIEYTIEKIRDISYKDRYCNKYPRFKTIDDITAIVVNF